MAAYRWVNGFGHLGPKTRNRSAPEPYAHFEYRTYFYRILIVIYIIMSCSSKLSNIKFLKILILSMVSQISPHISEICITMKTTPYHFSAFWQCWLGDRKSIKIAKTLLHLSPKVLLLQTQPKLELISRKTGQLNKNRKKNSDFSLPKIHNFFLVQHNITQQNLTKIQSLIP